MERRIFGRVASAVITAGGWLLAGARAVLDLIGYSTVPEDVTVAQTRFDQALTWFLGLPWWSVWGFALITTIWLIWVSWPRQPVKLAIIAGTKVILPAPKQIMSGHCKLSTERPQDSDRVIATGAPPHSVTNIRYRVTATDGAEMVLAGLSPKIAIREVGSIDGPILEGTGFAEVQLNRHSQFEIVSTCEDLEEEPWVHIELWLVGWITT